MHNTHRHTTPRAFVARRPAALERRSQPLSRRRQTSRPQPSLAQFVDAKGRPREVISQKASDGGCLVIDRDATTRGDCLLVAHLAADEPPENASLICEHYVRDPRSRDRCCRALSDEDTSTKSGSQDGELDVGLELGSAQIVDLMGRSYSLRLIDGGRAYKQLRWCRSAGAEGSGSLQPVCLREVVASLESYEPARAITIRALAQHQEDPDVSTTTLSAELTRVQESPIVLNRRLREVVLAATESNGLSMSEIALRCGRIKRDSNGNESGETSWLARRLGLLPDGGGRARTPWIHSDVLGLVARRGLGIAPCEVEL
jgi:hypothetical protein